MSWGQVKENGWAGGMYFLLQVYRVFGRWPLRFCLYPVVAWYFVCNPRARRASLVYLSRVGTVPATLCNSFCHFLAFAECLIDKLLVWSGALDVSRATLYGEEHVTAMIARGQGGIILTAHLGNLEYCRALSQYRQNFRINVLVHTLHSPQFNRVLKRINRDSDVNLIQISTLTPASALALQEKIAAGEFVIIAADRVPATNPSGVVSVPFLGHEALFPVGPVILAALFACPVLLAFSYKTQEGFELHIEPFVERITLPRKNRQERAGMYMARYAEQLAAFCRKAPLQWFNFYPFWIDNDK